MEEDDAMDEYEEDDYDDDLDERLDLVADVYPPLLLIEYDLATPLVKQKETVLEEVNILLCNDYDFRDALADNPSMLQRLKNRLGKGSDVAVPMSTKGFESEDKAIEQGLLNRAECACSQMLHFILAEHLIDANRAGRQDLFRAILREMDEAALLLKRWGSAAAIAKVEDMEDDDFRSAIALGRHIGVDLMADDDSSDDSE